MNAQVVSEIIESNKGKTGEIISILEEIQLKYGYLPREALEQVAAETGTSLVDIYGVATFYKAFSLEPRGKHVVSVCKGTACHVRGAPAVERAFVEKLEVEPGGTTKDKEFSLETVNCLGACALGPIVVADGRYFSNVGAGGVESVIDETRRGGDDMEVSTDQRIFPVKVSCPRCNHSLMDPAHRIDGHPSIRITMSFQHRHGWLRLSSLYGVHSHESEYDIPESTITHFFCPHCHTELNGASSCPECEAPAVPMIVSTGGMVQICSRQGCHWHRLDVG